MSTHATHISEYIEPTDHSPEAVAEEHRWLLLLIPLALCPAFFAIAIGTGIYWFLIPAAACGPWALITGLVHLAITSEANTPDEPGFFGLATRRRRRGA